MPRRKCRRNIEFIADVKFYKPQGIPLKELVHVIIDPDELEAIRLADLEGMYHEDAASSMGVSRQTFGRIIGSARRKVADALIGGKAIQLTVGS